MIAGNDRSIVANAAAVMVLAHAIEMLLARWLVTMDADQAAGLLRQMEAATLDAAEREPVDQRARDLWLLEIDRTGAAFYERLRRRLEALRDGHRRGRV